MSPPRLSVVVPTRRRPRQLGRCLEALARLDFPQDRFETVVVEDGGGGGAAEVARQVNPRTRVVERPRGGPAAARNAGAEEARGTYVVFLDDDCVPERDWLTALAARLDRTPEAAVAGRTENALAGNPYATATHLLVEHLYAVQTDEQRLHFYTSNNIAFPLAGFEAIGGFDASFPVAGGEDRELCARWIDSGRPLLYEPQALVRHEHDLTLPDYLRQHFNYGRGAFRFRAGRLEAGRDAPTLRTPAFYMSLLRSPFAGMPLRRAVPLALLLGLSQPATAAGYAWEAWRDGRTR